MRLIKQFSQFAVTWTSL